MAGKLEGGAVLPRKSALVTIHDKLEKSKATPRSPLLALPPETELNEGWTVADEVELAAAGQEFMDRFGVHPLSHAHSLSWHLLAVSHG